MLVSCKAPNQPWLAGTMVNRLSKQAARVPRVGAISAYERRQRPLPRARQATPATTLAEAPRRAAPARALRTSRYQAAPHTVDTSSCTCTTGHATARPSFCADPSDSKLSATLVRSLEHSYHSKTYVGCSELQFTALSQASTLQPHTTIGRSSLAVPLIQMPH